MENPHQVKVIPKNKKPATGNIQAMQKRPKHWVKSECTNSENGQFEVRLTTRRIAAFRDQWTYVEQQDEAHVINIPDYSR